MLSEETDPWNSRGSRAAHLDGDGGGVLNPTHLGGLLPVTAVPCDRDDQVYSNPQMTGPPSAQTQREQRCKSPSALRAYPHGGAH